jgi:hypothetical protein
MYLSRFVGSCFSTLITNMTQMIAFCKEVLIKFFPIYVIRKSYILISAISGWGEIASPKEFNQEAIAVDDHQEYENEDDLQFVRHLRQY